MQKTKIFSAAIAICMIALFTMSWKPTPPRMPGAVTILGVYDFSTFPNTTGTFTTTGTLTISGTTTMFVEPNQNGVRGHCLVVLTPSDGSGTITIHQECQFRTSPPQGQWQIVSGTGAYANLTGNGSLTMPLSPDGSHPEEFMTGVIY